MSWRIFSLRTEKRARGRETQELGVSGAGNDAGRRRRWSVVSAADWCHQSRGPVGLVPLGFLVVPEEDQVII